MAAGLGRNEAEWASGSAGDYLGKVRGIQCGHFCLVSSVEEVLRLRLSPRGTVA